MVDPAADLPLFFRSDGGVVVVEGLVDGCIDGVGDVGGDVEGVVGDGFSQEDQLFVADLQFCFDVFELVGRGLLFEGLNLVASFVELAVEFGVVGEVFEEDVQELFLAIFPLLDFEVDVLDDVLVVVDCFFVFEDVLEEEGVGGSHALLHRL